MTAAVELATAYISLVPSMTGVQGAIAQELAPTSALADREGKKAGKKFAGGFGGSMKGLAATIGGVFVAKKIGDFAKESVTSLKRVEKINAQTDARIAATGGAAKVATTDVVRLADSLERTTSMEAETVQEGANLLLTFKNVRNEAGKGADIFDRATKSVVDLSYAGFGSVETTSKQLGKALNDPVKGISALSRSGVTFTEQQKNQIKALVKTGDTLSAQKIILKEVESQVGGAGEAFRDTTEGKMAQFEHQVGNLGETLAAGLLPKLSDLAEKGLDAVAWIGDNPDKVKEYASMLGVLVGGLVAYKAAMMASAAFQAIYAAGTAGATGATWSLNAALRANPIGLVVTALTLLVGGMVLAYQRSEKFRSVVDTTWTAVKGAFSTAWAFISPVLSRIGSWVGARLPAAFGVLKAVGGVVFTVLKTHFKVWWTVVSTVFGLARKGIGLLVDAFGAAKRGISAVWDKLGDVIARPIRGAVRIINGFLNAIDSIPGVSLSFRVAEPGSGAKETGSDRAMAGRGPVRRATGGPVFGAGTSTSDSIQALLSNNEHVWTAREVAAAGGHRAVEAMRAAVLAGGGYHLPAFAAGGRVVAGTGKQHSRAQYPWASWAGDFPVPMGTPVHAWKPGVIALVRTMTGSYGKHIRMNHDDGTSSLYAHLSRFAVEMGERVRRGATIGYSGSTGNSTGPHLHAEFMGGPYKGGPAGGGGSIWDTLSGAAGKIREWIREKLTSKANLGGLMGDATGMFGAIGGDVKDWVLDKVFDDGGVAEGTGWMYKNTIQPERVLNPVETRKFDALLDGAGRGRGGIEITVLDFAITDWESGMARLELMVEDALDGLVDHERQLDEMEV
jgi:murein DD-endopeptidase MepM/ murein hydrolase activator NlpD